MDLNSHPVGCVTCGRFMRIETGASWRMVYSGYPPTPDHEENRCKSCTEKHGPLPCQHGIKPEFGAGIWSPVSAGVNDAPKA